MWRIIMESSNSYTSLVKRQEIAERAVRRVKGGTSVVLLQSRLDEKWWSDSMEYYFSLQNIKKLQTNDNLNTNEDLGNHSKDQLYCLMH